MAFRFEPLTKQHDGPVSLRKRASQYLSPANCRKDAERHVAAAFVMVDDTHRHDRGFLYAFRLFRGVDDLRKSCEKNCRGIQVAATLLGGWRAMSDFQARTASLMDALARAHQKSAEIASLAVVADAKMRPR